MNPWFEDPTDKTVLLQALHDIVDNLAVGMPMLLYTCLLFSTDRDLTQSPILH